mmetsp:Transcript_26131/g.25317  ORF Transcript_26131/g.25317 Transcript_26131/m.25317 type:complete len:99 (-) Transcript_26131:138-434(-)
MTEQGLLGGGAFGFGVFKFMQGVSVALQLEDLSGVCEFNNILSQLGKILTSLSAAGNALINGIFTFYNGEVSAIESNLNEEKWGAAGEEVGIFIKGFF